MKSFQKWPKISIIVSNYNGIQLGLVIDCLTSVLKCDYPNYEVLLVDNSSADESLKFIKRKFGQNKKLKIIRNKINMYSQGLNLGLENAKGNFIAFFNNDIEFKKGYFQEIINTFNRYSNVYLIQGKLVRFSYAHIIDSVGETMDLFGNPITIGSAEEDRGQYDKENKILSASGSASVIRREVLWKVGQFDEDFGIGYEDMDLALRLRLRGYEVLYIPNAVVYHKRGKTDLSPSIKLKVRWHFNKNRLATMIKNYPFSLLIKSLPVTFLLYIGTAFWEIFIKRRMNLGLTRFTSIFWIIRNLPALLKKRAEIRQNINKKGQENMVRLMSKKTLLKSFLSFVKA